MLFTDKPLVDIVNIKTGKLNSNAATVDGLYPFFTCAPDPLRIDRYKYDQAAILLAGNNAEGNFHINYYEGKFEAYQRTYIIDSKDPSKYDLKYIFYALKECLLDFKAMSQGTSTKFLTMAILNSFKIPVPDISVQKRIAHKLSLFDRKIEVNNLINTTLEEQALAIFDSMFPNVTEGEDKIGDYIVPKRGKGLLSKNAVPGDVPVVAGGLEPATYHNIANTIAPVVTISASGANAGFVNLWHIPVWSSDSSFIDSKATSDVYFWYVMLKKRQKEIFDAQTGSAQPHIYPQHIGVMPIGKINPVAITAYVRKVTPIFEMIGNNKKSNQCLSGMRDALLPRLMSGEI